MKTCFATLALLGGLACADNVRHRGTTVQIKFDEPVVPQSVCHNGWNSAASDSDKGLDLFDITGDDQHKPTARWVDQNILQLEFVEGTSCATEYRLSFRPGCAKYLGQAPMKQTSFTFKHPKTSLTSYTVPGLDVGAVVVEPRGSRTKEEQTFSEGADVTYVYQEIIEKEYIGPNGVHRIKRENGAVIPAVVSPAQLKHGLGRQGLGKLVKAKAEWESLTPESTLPQAVLVQPKTPLPAGTTWEVWSSDSAGFDKTCVSGIHKVDHDLATWADAAYDSGKRDLLVHVGFGAQLTVEEAERAWKGMEIHAGGAKAEDSADGTAKALTVNGKECRITLQKVIKPEAGGFGPRPYNEDDEDAKKPVPSEYVPQGVAEGLVLKVDGQTPAVLDFVVPQGITSALGGRKTLGAHRHRLSLNPAWPVLGSGIAPYRMGDRNADICLLPLKGEHKLRVPLVNADGLQAVAYRLPAQMLVKEAEKLNEAIQQDNTGRSIVNLQVRLERHANKVDVLDPKSLVSLQTELAMLRNKEQNPTAHGFTGRLKASQELKVDVAQGDNTNLSTAEAVLDMDSLLGGQAGPGIYLVRLTAHANPAVRQTLTELKLPENLLDLEQFALVQITDLNVITDDDSMKLVLVNRLSDGTPVQDAKVTPYVSEEKRGTFRRSRTFQMKQYGDPMPVTNGCMAFPPAFGDASGMSCILVECGDDYMVVGRGYGVWSPVRKETEYRSILQTDRSIYNPGDQVHVRGVLRSVSPEGVAALPLGTPVVNFRVRRPDGKDLVNRQAKLDASGGIDETFTLPAGEEDVTGSYNIEVSSPDHQYSARTYVRAEVFRRDSFKITSTLEVGRISPKEFTYTLQALDLNGTPVANGKATLSINSPVPLLTFQGEKRTLPEMRGDAKASPSVNIEREFKLDADGKVEIKGTFADFKPRDGGLLIISGNVANDREEYVRAKNCDARLYPADFIVKYDTTSGLITLEGVKNDGGLTKPLDREQKLHMALRYTAKEVKVLPNGFVFVSTKPAVLREEDITVPANCHEGVTWKARAMWDEFSKDKPDLEREHPVVVISGTDPEGRTEESEHTLYSWWFKNRGNLEVPVEASDSCVVGEDGKLHLSTTFLRDGMASFVIHCGGKVRTEIQAVKAGTQEILLPAMEGEEGNASVTVFLPHPDASGVFTRHESHSCDFSLPIVKYALQTKINVPKEAVLPGSKLVLDGQVTKDGKGVPATVTLFAVDEGMLSVSRFQVQDLLKTFTGVDDGGSFDLTTAVYPWEAEDTHRRPYRSMVQDVAMMPGIWYGGMRGYHDMGGGDMRYAMPQRAEMNGLVTAGAVCFDAMTGEAECAPAPEPMAVQVSAKAAPRGAARASVPKKEAAPMAAPCMIADDCDEDEDDGAVNECAVAEEEEPRLRTNFQPVAVWQGVLKTDAEGRFSTEVTLPDTLTTYKLYAMVLGDNGSTFGNVEESFTVNQPLMLTPGTPLFMSTGDTLRLPLTVTNNTDKDGTWTVTISSAQEPQKVTVKAHATATIYFDFTAVEEGTATLAWKAVGGNASDAVQGSFPVRFPAPLLKEAHHLVLAPGESRKLAELMAPELATSTRGEVEIHMSANPLLHLIGCMDYLLTYPYGCTEQTASGLLPWLFYDRLAPLSPLLAETPADKVHEVISKSVETLFKRQLADGGLGYWNDSRESSGWASAHAALVLTIAQDQGHGACIPQDKMEKLRTYLRGYLAELRKDGRRWDATNPMTLFALGRVLGDDALLDEALGIANKDNEARREWGCFWHRDIGADLSLIRDLRKDPAKKHEAFLRWMRARGHDYRHTTTLRSGWMLIALNEYLRITPASTKEAVVQLENGLSMTLNQGVTVIKPQAKPLSDLPTVLKAVEGEVYVTFKVKAQPNQTEYPGVVEKGLQITRIYEKKGADGIWREAKEFSTGDVVRVTLTCAKSAPELEYFVLEDYLPSCMEAINPNVPSQAAGLEFTRWSHWFDHKEYLADRVRGFCTRWGGRDLLNMTYYARVKRSGTCTAPPSQAQLMYEPQTYGLSPNAKIQSK